MNNELENNFCFLADYEVVILLPIYMLGKQRPAIIINLKFNVFCKKLESMILGNRYLATKSGLTILFNSKYRSKTPIV